jgi:hypothetical protein
MSKRSKTRNKGDLKTSDSIDSHDAESQQAQLQLTGIQQGQWESEPENLPQKSNSATYTFDTLSYMKIGEIRQILRDQKKRITGNKEDLISVRLFSHRMTPLSLFAILLLELTKNICFFCYFFLSECLERMIINLRQTCRKKENENQNRSRWTIINRTFHLRMKNPPQNDLKLKSM